MGSYKRKKGKPLTWALAPLDLVTITGRTATVIPAVKKVIYFIPGSSCLSLYYYQAN